MKIEHKSIGIVGGGLLGRLLALELFERGYSVTLFEKGSSDGSSSCGYVGLGMLSPWSELPNVPLDDSVTLKLGILSIDRWAYLLNKIGAQENFFNKGSLVIARREELGTIENFKKLLRNCQDQNFIEVSQDCRFYNNLKTISHYEPEVSANFFHGLFLPQEGCLDTKSVFLNLTNYFSKIGLPVFYNCGDCEIRNENEIFIPCFVDEQERSNLQFNFLVDTRGLGGKTSKNNLRGVRGEALRVLAPEVNITRLVRVIDSKFPLYIVPRGNSIYTLGATSIESEDKKPISVRSVLELLSMARYVHEGFMEASILETLVQWRPAYSDNKPKIIFKNNFMSMNGLFRHGIMCAPALAQLGADLIAGIKRNGFEDINEN